MPPPKKQWQRAELLVCRPLNSYDEIFRFIASPPAWRSLCVELQPHSRRAIKNRDLVQHFVEISLKKPPDFCRVEEEEKEGTVPRHGRNTLPKTLVCHDMANGYHDDSLIEGTGNASAYTFYNWAAVDVFCYFSHHLITIPPLAWINVAHKHGCKVIGTLITEWTDGEKFWEVALATDDSVRSLAHALTAIAVLMRFDGWLLNIENKVSRPDKLLSFVRELHRALHAELPHAELIWYDSVTRDGHLIWQNKLNENNKPFFDACDGLFTNYSWSVADVAESAAAAESRRRDVYIGLDVWGRNFFGGGMFNLQKAVKVVHASGCSLAIFAPAWTHEALLEDRLNLRGDLQPYEVFLLRDRALWGSIWPYLNTRLPSALPLQTSFCRGQGLQRRMYGEVLSAVPWYNLRHMQYQPNSIHSPQGFRLHCLKEAARIQMNATQAMGEVKDSENRLIAISKLSKKLEETYLNAIMTNDGDLSTKTVIEMTSSINQNEATKCERPEEPEQTESEIQIIEELNKEKCRYVLELVVQDQDWLKPYWDDCFSGGSCLRVLASDSVRLFHCDIQVKSELVAVVVTKRLPGYPKQSLNIYLDFPTECDPTQKLRVVLSGSGHESFPAPSSGECIQPPLSGPHLEVLQRLLVSHQPEFYVPVENCFGWNVMYYSVRVPRTAIACTSVSLRTQEEGPILLGHFGLVGRPHAASPGGTTDNSNTSP